MVGKGENAGNQHFLCLPQCFQSIKKKKIQFVSHIFFFFSSAKTFNLDQFENLLFDKELGPKQKTKLSFF